MTIKNVSVKPDGLYHDRSRSGDPFRVIHTFYDHSLNVYHQIVIFRKTGIDYMIVDEKMNPVDFEINIPLKNNIIFAYQGAKNG